MQCILRTWMCTSDIELLPEDESAVSPLTVAANTCLVLPAPFLVEPPPLTLLRGLVKHLCGLKSDRKVIQHFPDSDVLGQLLLEGDAFPSDEVDG